MNQTELQFRQMTDDVPTMIWTSTPDHLGSHCNRSWLKFTGMSQQQTHGDGWKSAIHSEDLVAYLKRRSAACELRTPFTSEYRLRRADGEYRWVAETAVPRMLSNGEFGGYVGTCVDISENRESEEALRQLPDRLLQAQEAERRRIARELHDDIGQELAILTVQMRRAGKPVSDLPGRAHPAVGQLCDKVVAIAKKLSRISHQLHSSKLELLGLQVAIQGTCREFAEVSRLAVECNCENVPEQIDEMTGLSILRVVQEALHNIAKHANATTVKVELVGSTDRVDLTVQDDGHGFDVESARLASGLGLMSMRERIHMAGGQFEMLSSNRGTTIRAHVPVAGASKATSEPAGETAVSK